LKRFAAKKGEVIKIHTQWKLEQELNIRGRKYRLAAVVCHSGMRVDSGHYTAIADNVKYDDELVTNMKYS
jgi:ubiquitin C-terminal hydrolase